MYEDAMRTSARLRRLTASGLRTPEAAREAAVLLHDLLFYRHYGVSDAWLERLIAEHEEVRAHAARVAEEERVYALEPHQRRSADLEREATGRMAAAQSADAGPYRYRGRQGI